MPDTLKSSLDMTSVLPDYPPLHMTGQPETKARMLAAAGRLFQRQGYSATSWRAIVDEASTPWGSAHHYFPEGKEALAAEALALGDAEVSELIGACLAETSTAGDAVRAWFQSSARLMRESDFRSGCPVATVALRIGNPAATAAACSGPSGCARASAIAAI